MAVLGPLGLRRRDGVSAIDHIAWDGGPIGVGECEISGVGMAGEKGLSDGRELGLTLTRGPC